MFLIVETEKKNLDILNKMFFTAKKHIYKSQYFYFILFFAENARRIAGYELI